jgi:2-amino-4-hydroxy-6-hydroxymethyldihydropteridine diphosphokinase
VILIGIGASLPGRDGATPLATCEAAVRALTELPGLCLTAISGWWESAPVPPMPGAPWFVNGVARLEGEPDPAVLLARLHAIEAAHHRARPFPNAPRTLDLDLLDCNGALISTPGLHIPHPRMAERAFVLLPLAEVAPEWHHPATGQGVQVLLAALPEQRIRPLQAARSPVE